MDILSGDKMKKLKTNYKIGDLVQLKKDYHISLDKFDKKKCATYGIVVDVLPLYYFVTFQGKYEPIRVRRESVSKIE